MRSSRLVRCLLIAFALIALPVMSFALPRGNYTRSCNFCHIYNNVLFCKCRTRSGAWMSAHYDNPYRRCDYMVNSNGRLSCATPRRQVSYTLPYGSYKRTCGRCRIRRNGSLACYCRTRNGSNRYTTMRAANMCRYVINNNGYLQCQTSRTALPSGSYIKTCQSCRYNGSTLRCLCKMARSGAMRNTKLRRAYRCASISNQNGRLSCQY